MTFATPTGPPCGPGSSVVEPVDVEHELAALRVALDHARNAPAELDEIEAELEIFLAALTQTPQLRFGHGASTATSMPCRTSWSSLPRAS